ncbi:MAG: right-handed parallel beta-helix repeat-containing protein, partial [Planctomycetota bacterium]
MKTQILLAMVVVFAVTPWATATTYYVDGASGNDSWDGLAPVWVSGTNGPKQTIQAAIDVAAVSGDEVIVAATTYFENVEFLSKEVDVHSSDVNNPAGTIIDGSGSGSVVLFENCGPGAKLRGFTVRNGFADYGGGILCDGGSPTISDCIIEWNRALFYGGGIECFDASPTISDCIIQWNTARDNSSLYDSGSGGGIDLYRSAAQIVDCIIRDNDAEIGGGAIFSDDSSPAVSFCNINGNDAEDFGGGISCYNSSGTIKNCFIRDNHVQSGRGGAVHFWNASTEISNCTIIYHQSGIYCDSREFADPSIKNSILWYNVDDLYDCEDVVRYSCIRDNDGDETNTHDHPLFVIGPGASYYLSSIAAGQLVDSPCIDAGSGDANDPDIGMDQYTTRTDQALDSGTVD